MSEYQLSVSEILKVFFEQKEAERKTLQVIKSKRSNLQYHFVSLFYAREKSRIELLDELNRMIGANDYNLVSEYLNGGIENER